MSKRFHKWYIVCILIGIAAFLVVLYIWKDYILAENKFQTEALLTDVNIQAKQKLKDKNDPTRDNFHLYDTYYEYKLTWEFMNVYSEKKYKYYNETEGSNENLHKAGEKQPVFVYYNDNEEDYELVDAGASILFIIGGAVFIIIPATDLIRRKIRKEQRFISGVNFTHTNQRMIIYGHNTFRYLLIINKEVNYL